MFALVSSDLVIVDGNARNVRPTAGGSGGTSVAPGASNSKGGWTQLIASTADTTHGILLSLNTDTGASRSKLIDIGIGAAAAETVLIPDLVCGPATALYTNSNAGGIWYYFPIRVAPGTRISARGQVNNATAGTVLVLAQLYKARQPHRYRSGSRVVAYGIDAANSRGTAITEGAASEGSHTELGTIAAGDRPWYFEFGVTVDAAALTARQHNADLFIGDATNKRVIIEDKVMLASTTPAYWSTNPVGEFTQGIPGEKLYGRQQSSSTAEATTWYHAAYGVI